MTGNVRFRTFRNTHLMGPKALYTAVVSDSDVEATLAVTEPKPGSPGSRLNPSLARRVARRLRPWFWPSLADAEPWASASEDTWYQPSAYLITEPGPLLVRLMATTQTHASILDLGCNSGSNLNLLFQAGYRRLHGVDAGGRALELFKATFPDTWSAADVRHDLFQRYLLNCPDEFVDALHSNGATLELVHPSFPIVAEICRVTRDAVYLDIRERGHAYPRKYIEQFRSHGFALVYCERPLDLVNQSSILHFRRVP